MKTITKINAPLSGAGTWAVSAKNSPASRPGDVVGGAIAAAAGPGLLGSFLSRTAVDRIIGGAQDAFEIFGTAMRALHFHGILAAQRQKFKKFIALQALKFIYRHR
jgi:hypothetical protein